MKEIENALRELDQFSTVVVAGARAHLRHDLLETLHRHGVNVMGPVDSAAKALTLIAQSHADLAIIESTLSGRRDGHELAHELRHTWGVPTVMMSGDAV